MSIGGCRNSAGLLTASMGGDFLQDPDDGLHSNHCMPHKIRCPLSSAEDGGAFICLRSGSKAMNLRAVAIKKDA